jgi:4-amino-4-deoxychorismate lyase
MSHPKFNIFINPKNISIYDRGFNYGDGLFETILVKDSEVKYLTDHIKRLHDGCKKLKFTKPSLDLLKKNIKKAIGKNTNCIIKIILTRGSGLFGYKFIKDISHNLYFIKHNKVSMTKKNKLVKLKISNYNIYENSDLAKIKHLNRIDQCLIASELNNQKNIDDLVVTYNNNIIETLSSNIFFVKINKSNLIFNSPKISKCGIDGIIKNQIIKFLKNKKYRVLEKDIPVESLMNFDVSFKVNSIQGLVFIDQIENNKFSKNQIIYNILKDFIY